MTVSEQGQAASTIRIAPQVLATIVSLTTQQVAGVARLGQGGHGVNLSRNVAQNEPGVRVRVREGRVTADVYVVVATGSNMQKVGQEVQRQVGDALSKMVGMPVEAVNVYVEDVEG